MKVYMKADENDAGVTVEDDGVALAIGVPNREPFASWIPLNDAAARAVVEGLLRRMLERDGEAAVMHLVARLQHPYGDGR